MQYCMHKSCGVVCKVSGNERSGGCLFMNAAFSLCVAGIRVHPVVSPLSRTMSSNL